MLHALSFLLQPILAGLFLSGQDTAIDSHATNAMVVVTLCLVMTVLAFPAWRRGLVPRAAFTISAALLVVEIVQTGAGFGHVMWIHIPLGVLMMGGVAQLMPMIMRTYTPAAASAAAVVPFPAAEAGE
ncbi:hypothetical protein [Catenulispora sp. GP43]|uniref:hypothetical protein n=1 Tax=Catenulispora sp. GP43 TaxID=3156263 RepID=UPI003512A774